MKIYTPNITGSFTASLESGFTWVGDANNLSTKVATSSFGGASVTSPGDNRVVTSDGTAGGLVGEASMSFTQDGGGLLQVTGSVSASADIDVNGITIGRSVGNITTNTVVGSKVLINNTTGNCNTAVGNNALCANTSGFRNTAVGTYALRNNTTGACNTAVGWCALRSNTTGLCNTAVGSYTLRANTTGCRNTAVGNDALGANTSGFRNTAIGNCALRNNTAGACNTAVGVYALNANTLGTRNTAVGFSALQSNTTGTCNTAVGTGALLYSTSGGCNIAVGSYTLRCNRTGNYNTAVGWYALRANTSGNSNTAIGFGANSGSITVQDNTIAVGANAFTSATTGHTVWGSPLNNVCNCVWSAWADVSDCRDKTNIKPISKKLGLDLLKKITPVEFNLDNRFAYVQKCAYEYGEKDGTLASEKKHYGIIAQELKEVLNELSESFDAIGYDEKQDAYRITYQDLIPSLIHAIKELDERVSLLEKK